MYDYFFKKTKVFFFTLFPVMEKGAKDYADFFPFLFP